MSQYETLLDRFAEALSEALYMAGPSDYWEAEASRTLLAHAAAELLALERCAGRPLSLQDAAQFLATGGEGSA